MYFFVFLLAKIYLLTYLLTYLFTHSLTHLSQKLFCFIQKTRTRFLKGNHKEYIYIQNYKAKKVKFLSWSSWKWNKNIFCKYFPGPKFSQLHSLWKLHYSVFVLHIQDIKILFKCYDVIKFVIMKHEKDFIE